MTIDTTHQPALLACTIQVRMGIAPTNPAKPDDTVRAPDLDALIAWAHVDLELDQALVTRLFELWNVVLAAEADEIADWALPASAHLSVAVPVPAPDVSSVSATVYADGTAAFAVLLDGYVSPLWCTELLDLSLLEQAESIQS